jgi:hypothetical protein
LQVFRDVENKGVEQASKGLVVGEGLACFGVEPREELSKVFPSGCRDASAYLHPLTC